MIYSEFFYSRLLFGALNFRKNKFALGGDPHIQYYNRHCSYVLRPSHTVEWLLELQSRDAPEATWKAFQHWLELERAWQCIEVMNGKLQERAFPTDLAIAHSSSAVQNTSRPRAARVRGKSRPGHVQRKAS